MASIRCGSAISSSRRRAPPSAARACWSRIRWSRSISSAQRANLGRVRDAGGMVAKVLQGRKPADTPIQRPSKFELVINLKTARALGLSMSDNLVTLADEVIEWGRYLLRLLTAATGTSRSSGNVRLESAK